MKKDNKDNNNIFKILLNDDKVNNYTKLYLILNRLDYYKKYYIPNQLIMKELKLSCSNSQKLIAVFKKRKIIRIYYKGNKRYFEFIDNNTDDKDNFRYIPTEKEQEEIRNILDYNWLED